MKLIRSQDKLQALNAEHLLYIWIFENVDEDGEETGKMDIDAYLNYGKKDKFLSLATYNTEAECIRHLDRLLDFLSSTSTSGVYEMPKF